ncbi:MAG: histidine phosphatase family protein, partial [Actinomycetia bacterium]|nr:histidine phosphatase family protein [Actinomycetes bacterium]
MNLLVIRHPEPLGSQGVCYGQSDLSVDPAVLELIASRLRQQLAGSKVDLWLSSPLQRCSQLAARLDPGYQTDPRLLEMNFGDWEGQRWDDIDRTDLDTWSADYINAAPPGGESFMALQQRVAS